MRNIRVSDEVWSAIAERGKFGETADDVLRRVFKIPLAHVSGGPTASALRRRMRFEVTLLDLIRSGKLVPDDTKLFARYKRQQYVAVVRKNATVAVIAPSPEALGEYPSLSAAGVAIRESQETNGWDFFHVRRQDGSLVKVGSLR